MLLTSAVLDEVVADARRTAAAVSALSEDLTARGIVESSSGFTVRDGCGRGESCHGEERGNLEELHIVSVKAVTKESR